MAASDVLALLEQITAAAERQDRAALRRLIAAYGAFYRRIEPRVLAIAEQALRENLTAAQVRRLSDFRDLERAAAAELRDFSGLLIGEIVAGSVAAAALGSRHAQALLFAAIAGGPARDKRLRALSVEALDVITEFVRVGSPLRQRIELLAPFHAQRVADALIDAIAKGWNPRKTASAIQDVFGNGLTDALRMTRTAQLYAYRESTRQTYDLNGVDGWQWYANLDGKTCMSCVAMHGTVHDNEERLNDHHNGRCVMIPIVDGQTFVSGTGQAWFEQLPEAQQAEQMGRARWEAWQAGRFEFSKLSRERADDVYGQMRSEASLKELVGNE